MTGTSFDCGISGASTLTGFSFDWEIKSFDWEMTDAVALAGFSFDWEVKSFDWEIKSFDWEVTSFDRGVRGLQSASFSFASSMENKQWLVRSRELDREFDLEPLLV